jgi:3'-5' exoribonuclease
MRLSDGTDDVSANWWDYYKDFIPPVNSIYNFRCKVESWQGMRQLNIMEATENTELHISEFVPTGKTDISQAYKDAFSMMSDVRNDTLRSVGLYLLDEYQALWTCAPAATSVHHAYVGGTLIHSVEVAKIGIGIAAAIPEAYTDLVIAGGLLHDVGKLLAYSINGATIDLTDTGKMLEHVMLGYQMIDEAKHYIQNVDPNAVNLLKHIVASHHGKYEFGAAAVPLCLEAYIVHHADMLSAQLAQIVDASNKLQGAQWTDKIWALNNRPHLTVEYVRKSLT